MNTGDVTMDTRSRKRLEGVHKDLQAVIYDAASQASNPRFIVTEGVRTLARQRELLAAGASRTLRSRHLTGHAVDLAVVVNGEVRWDWPLYVNLGRAIKLSANRHKISIVWGGDWRGFRDGPHFELNRKVYPAA